MENRELYALLCLGHYVLVRRYRRRLLQKYKRRWWCRPINSLRFDQGDFAHLFQELKEDSDMFFKYTRMNEDTFNLLLRKLRTHLQKSNWRALPPEQRLIVTLRYLATGDQMTSIALAYRIGVSTAHVIVRETCEIISNVLHAEYLAPPTLNEWKNISTGFWTNWNFPNTIGAMDGKHIQIQAPPASGISRWRIFRRPICAYPSTADRYVMACIILHNFLMTNNEKEPLYENIYCPPNLIDHDDETGRMIPGTWRNENLNIENLRPCTAHRATREAYQQRDTLTKYLLSPVGEILWQYEHIHRGSNRDLLYE